MPDALTARQPTRPGDLAARRRIPGEIGIWVFVLGDLVMFSAFFGCFLHDRATRAALFDASQAQLHLSFGAFNTCLLVTGSLFVVWAVHAARDGDPRPARRWLSYALACAAVFGLDKILEWGEKIASGTTPATNLYFMYFYMFTGLHAVHLVIGIVVLARMRRLCHQPRLSPTQLRTLEVGGTYWHLVDLLWVVLFALLYLLA